MLDNTNTILISKGGHWSTYDLADIDLLAISLIADIDEVIGLEGYVRGNDRIENALRSQLEAATLGAIFHFTEIPGCRVDLSADVVVCRKADDHD